MEPGRGLAWRLGRHGLDPVSGTDVADVVRRVVALRGWPSDRAGLAIAARQVQPEPGALARALETGEVVRIYAFRGGSYVLTPDDGAALLALRTATRLWETRRWQRQGGFELADWEPLRDAVREVLASGPGTRAEIAAHLAHRPTLRHLVDAAATGAGSDALYKPLHWWGDICFGPDRDGRSTFRLLHDDARWPRPPDVDEAGRRAVVRYLEQYGPATDANLRYWLVDGLGVPAPSLASWVADLGDDLTRIRFEDEDAHVLTADVDALLAAEPSEAVLLLPGHDPWVMGPGTADPRVVPSARRGLATRGADLVLRGGVVCGTWRVRRRTLTVSWFEEAGPEPTAALGQEVERVATLRGHELHLEVALAHHPAGA